MVSSVAQTRARKKKYEEEKGVKIDFSQEQKTPEQRMEEGEQFIRERERLASAQGISSRNASRQLASGELAKTNISPTITDLNPIKQMTPEDVARQETQKTMIKGGIKSGFEKVGEVTNLGLPSLGVDTLGIFGKSVGLNEKEINEVRGAGVVAGGIAGAVGYGAGALGGATSLIPELGITKMATSKINSGVGKLLVGGIAYSEISKYIKGTDTDNLLTGYENNANKIVELAGKGGLTQSQAETELSNIDEQINSLERNMHSITREAITSYTEGGKAKLEKLKSTQKALKLAKLDLVLSLQKKRENEMATIQGDVNKQLGIKE